jgi:hypothetical protein
MVSFTKSGNHDSLFTKMEMMVLKSGGDMAYYDDLMEDDNDEPFTHF